MCIVKEQIYTNEKNCVGCNKCLSNCPAPGANIAYTVDGNNKVKVNTEKCIRCGECIKACDHNARAYKDDTGIFFEDLKSGKKISLIVAASVMVNFKEYKKLLGYLKKLGVNLIYDEAFGADITAWAYAKVLKKKKLSSMIAGTCPPIISYIEKYEPELIEKLAPIYSPMMNTAIFMKKYAQIKDEIAFLSPCIAATDEINDGNTYGYVKYNVTFKKLKEYLEANNIDISQNKEENFDNIGSGLGILFSRPGGLKENLELYAKGAWVRQISGAKQFSYSYLKGYKKNLEDQKDIPTVIDIMNCSNGCNFGTGVCNKCTNPAEVDEVEYKFNKLKEIKKAEISEKATKRKANWLHDYFNKTLNLEDFRRVFNKNIIVNDILEPTETQYNEIYNKMYKLTQESRSINCLACGYGSCKTMALCIFNKLNVLTNCIDYNKKEVAYEHSLSESKNEFFTNISHELRTPLNVIYSVLQLEYTYRKNFSAEDIIKYSSIIRQNCLRLIRLVNNLIDLSRIEAGFFKPIFKVENIVSEVENIALSIMTYVEHKKMNLIFDTEMEELYLSCDTNLIERIMLNLLSNSVKYGKENGTIKVYIYKPDFNQVSISVKDDGIGIPQDMQKKIFERFQKVDKSLSRKNEGSGIGLSLVKSLVELQGGTIECKSDIDVGSEFIITFPIGSRNEENDNIGSHILYKKNSSETVNIEFSDIYFEA